MKKRNTHIMMAAAFLSAMPFALGQGEVRTLPKPSPEALESLKPAEAGKMKAQKALTADEKLAVGWHLIRRAGKDKEKISKGLKHLKDVPDVKARLMEVVKVTPQEPRQQQGERLDLIRGLANTKSKLAVEFLISLLDQCDAPPDPHYNPDRDYGPPPPLCHAAAETLNGMGLPDAPFGEFHTPKPEEREAFKAAWEAWYEQNKNTLVD